MNVRVLAPASARRWFEALSPFPPEAEDIRRMEGLLATGLFRPHMRMVVERQGEPLGRMAAQVKDGVIRFWNPSFRAGTSIEAVEHAMRLMVARVAAARKEAGLTNLVIETRPGDDLPDNHLWLRVLAELGYAQTCVYRVYELPLDKIAARNRALALSIREIHAADEKDLVALYRRVKARTLEQRDVRLDRPEDAIDANKAIGGGHNPTIWIMGLIEGVPAGYALANLAAEPDFEGLSAWLLDIGCVPEQRRKGIASILLGEIARRLKMADARRLLAAIDDVNLPSIGLHGSLGFEALRHRHYIHRLP
jgi:GNAT superfamily N-acetyltransferase